METGVGVNIFLLLDVGCRVQGCDQMLSRGGGEYKPQYSQWQRHGKWDTEFL